MDLWVNLWQLQESFLETFLPFLAFLMDFSDIKVYA